jgi:uncharacterized membrane protein
MTSSDPRRRAAVSARRIEAFTDGVFAIAATLLVLDLSVDKLGLGQNASSEAVWLALGSDWQALMSFGISFLLLCLLWAVHVRQFEYIVRVDTAVLTLNSLRLLGVVLVPFTTSLTSDFNDTLPGRILLPANFLYVIAFGTIQWFYATAPGRGLVSGISDEDVRTSRINSLVAMIVAAIVTVASAWIGPYAFILFAINSIGDGIVARSQKRRSAGPDRSNPSDRRDHT